MLRKETVLGLTELKNCAQKSTTDYTDYTENNERICEICAICG
jgi:hypothetical protein